MRPELVLRAWASSRLDFFRAKIIRVNRQLGSATIVWAGEDDDEEDAWESDEEELPLAYLRSISGHEDLINAEGTSQHSPSHGGSKLEQRLSKAVEIRRAVGDAQAMHSASGDYHHHSPTSRPTSNPLRSDDAPLPNELSGLLDEFGVYISQYQYFFCTQLWICVKPVAFLPVQTNHCLLRHLYITTLTQLGRCYEKVVAYARGTSLEKHLRPLGEKELIEAGIPIMKARKVILAEIEITVICTEPIL